MTFTLAIMQGFINNSIYLLSNKLRDSIIEKQDLNDLPTNKNSPLIRAILAIPAMLGFIGNAPLYYPIRGIARNKTKGTEFYDAVLFTALLALYPPYVLLLTVVSISFFSWAGLSALVLLPLSAKAWSMFKE